MRRLSEQRVTLRAQLAEQSSTLLDQHPRIKELRAQIADLERQMRARGRSAGALARKRCQARQQQGGGAQRRARPAQAAGGLDQRAGRAAARARTRCQVAARSARNPISPNIARRPRATASARRRPMRASSRPRSSPTRRAWPKKLPIVLVAALAMFALSSGFVLTGELLGALPDCSCHARPMPMPALPAAAASATEVKASAVDRSGRPAGRRSRPRAPRRRAARGGRDAGARAAAPAAKAPAASRSIGPRAMSARPWPPSRLRAACQAGAGGAGRSGLGVAQSLGHRAAIRRRRASPSWCSGSASFGQIITRDRHSRVHLIMAGRRRVDADAVMARSGCRSRSRRSRAAMITWSSMPARSRTLRSTGLPIWRRARCWWRAISIMRLRCRRASV